MNEVSVAACTPKENGPMPCDPAAMKPSSKGVALGVDLLWAALGDIPVNDDGELEADFLHFIAGDDQVEVWHWFEAKFPGFSVGDRMSGKGSAS